MTSKQLEPEKPKKPYVKPEFIQVALRPEEAVLGHCKSMTGAGPANRGCTTTGCNSVGS